MSNKYFAVIDQYENDPEDTNGRIRIKEPAFRDRIVCVKREAHTGPDGVFYPAACRSCNCTLDGIYSINEQDEFFKEKLAVMTSYAKRTGRIVGPFDSPTLARIEAEKARPKTEIEKLREKVAAFEAKEALQPEPIKTPSKGEK